jgi:hypothetical protein
MHLPVVAAGLVVLAVSRVVKNVVDDAYKAGKQLLR